MLVKLDLSRLNASIAVVVLAVTVSDVVFASSAADGGRSPRPGERIIAALWRSTGKLDPPACRVEEANFKIDKDYGVKMEPVVTNLLAACTNSPCFNRRYRFEAETNSRFRVRWVSVEYLTGPTKDFMLENSLWKWVEAPLIFGQPLRFDAPAGVSVEVVGFSRVRLDDKPFVRKHGLNGLCVHAATLRIDGHYHRAVIASMARGREYWKMEVVYRLFERDGKPILDDKYEWSIPGWHFGGFEILDKGRRE